MQYYFGNSDLNDEGFIPCPDKRNDTEKEFQECMNKARAVVDAVKEAEGGLE